MGTKKDGFLLADVNTQLKKNNITTDIKVDTSSNLFATFTIDEPAPGLRAIISARLPDQRSGRLELQYLHDLAAVSGSIGLTVNPVVNFSGVVGNNLLAFGTDLSYDTKTGEVSKFNGGVSYTKEDFTAAVTLNNKGDLLTGSLYHNVNLTTAAGVEMTRSFSTNETTITIGSQHAWDPLTTFKTRANNLGKVNALIQHEWRPKSFVTISGEVDTKAIEKSAKIGLALALKP
ncbi:hypothetical protein Tsubulata_008880 [Turnera subulata]|uniref:Uncharacterized protein n=1 Tax=Turnera subulata TaxID=218843 RepID=A0A9Q0JAP9_9ROSI|nr:hypothetical protein Tsubulata_008880 [Turnera subulata]